MQQCWCLVLYATDGIALYDPIVAGWDFSPFRFVFTPSALQHLLIFFVCGWPPLLIGPLTMKKKHVTRGLKAFDLHCFSTFSSISTISSECPYSLLSSLPTDCCFPRCTEIVLYIKVSYLFLSSLCVLLDNKIHLFRKIFHWNKKCCMRFIFKCMDSKSPAYQINLYKDGN